MKTYRIDIDGTIAEPCFFHDDFQTCVKWYIQKGIVTQEDTTTLQFHQQLFLLPHVLITHRAIEGAVQTLQEREEEGATLQYFTVRQNFDPVLCERVHSTTRDWLAQQHFPCPMQVRFFWDAREKLLASLEAEEENVFLIDDRPEGLLKAYMQITHTDPVAAHQIQQRVTLVAFGCADIKGLPDTTLPVVPLADWSLFRALF